MTSFPIFDSTTLFNRPLSSRGVAQWDDSNFDLQVDTVTFPSSLQTLLSSVDRCSVERTHELFHLCFEAVNKLRQVFGQWFGQTTNSDVDTIYARSDVPISSITVVAIPMYIWASINGVQHHFIHWHTFDVKQYVTLTRTRDKFGIRNWTTTTLAPRCHCSKRIIGTRQKFLSSLNKSTNFFSAMCFSIVFLESPNICR